MGVKLREFFSRLRRGERKGGETQAQLARKKKKTKKNRKNSGTELKGVRESNRGQREKGAMEKRGYKNTVGKGSVAESTVLKLALIRKNQRGNALGGKPGGG